MIVSGALAWFFSGGTLDDLALYFLIACSIAAGVVFSFDVVFMDATLLGYHFSYVGEQN
jgi:hypothetical protein